MNLKGQWEILTQNLKSPDLFLEFSFYWMIGAALQRRVWLGSHHQPIIPSLYVFLVGGPGVGKGIIVDNLSAIMQYHKFRPANPSDDKGLEARISKMEKEGASPEVLETLRKARDAMAEVRGAGEKKIQTKDLYLFPQGADATTFESLVEQHASSVRTFHVGSPTPMAPSGLYTYHSMNLIVEEASSLFNEKSDRVAQYLLRAYNAQDYKYKTKHQGEDNIKRCSLALLAGTTPEFMKQIFGIKILNDGFASRTMYVYGAKSRFENWEIPPETLEQKSARDKIYQRLKELSQLFGQCHFTSEARRFMDDRYKGEEMKIKRNNDPKLEGYYSRHGLHIQKMALCHHFVNNDSLDIGVESLESAEDLLLRGEETMHLCLNVTGRNPIGSLQRSILKFIEKKNGASYAEICVEFFDEGDFEAITKALEFLALADKVESDGIKYTLKNK